MNLEAPAGVERAPKTTRLVIEKTQPQFGFTAEGAGPFVVASLHVRRAAENADERQDVNRFIALPNIGELKVYVRELGDAEEVTLPEDMVRKLAAYLRDISTNGEEFDCTRFAHYLKDVRYTFDQNISLSEDWNIGAPQRDIRIKDGMLSSGDIVAFLKEEKNRRDVRHMAVYLDNDVFLSQSGRNGKLLASSLATTMQMYGTKEWALLTPNADAPRYDGAPRERA